MRFEYEVRHVRSVMAPRWWHIRRRYRRWQAKRARERALAQLSVKEREFVLALEKEWDRQVLFGDYPPTAPLQIDGP